MPRRPARPAAAPPFFRPGNRRHLLRRRVLQWGIGCALVWIGYVFVFSNYGLRNLIVLRRSEAELSARIEHLEARRAALARTREALRDDPEAIEKVARETYLLGREGELTYVFVPVDSAGVPLPPRASRVPADPGRP